MNTPTASLNRPTQVIAEFLHASSGSKDQVLEFSKTAARSKEIVQKFLRSEGDLRPATDLEYHLLADSLETWVTDQVLSSGDSPEILRRLGEAALEMVEWMALAKKMMPNSAATKTQIAA